MFFIWCYKNFYFCALIFGAINIFFSRKIFFASFSFEKCNVLSCHASIYFVEFTYINLKLLLELLITANATKNAVIFSFIAIEVLKVMILILLKLRFVEKDEKIDFADFWKFCFANFLFYSFLFCSIFQVSCSRIFRLSKFSFNKNMTTFNLKILFKVLIRFSIKFWRVAKIWINHDNILLLFYLYVNIVRVSKLNQNNAWLYVLIYDW